MVLGTGDTAPTLYDYKLAGDLVTGFTYSRTVTSGKDEKGPWARVKYTITNNNAAAVTIKEIALLAGNTVCMIERSVLEKPITIEGGGGVGQIEHPSISPRHLIWALARKIKDKKFLKLVYEITTSNPEGGLAIGYYINQWLANYYLETLDHFILTLPGVKHYVRNMDDMVIMGPNKKQLHRVRREVEAFLNRRLGLRMKENWQVFPVKARGIDFVGYRYFRNYTIMRRRNFLRFARQCRRVRRRIEQGRPIDFHTAAGLLSRAGQLKHCDAHGIRVKYIDPIRVKRLKNVVREHSRKKAAEKAA